MLPRAAQRPQICLACARRFTRTANSAARPVALRCARSFASQRGNDTDGPSNKLSEVLDAIRHLKGNIQRQDEERAQEADQIKDDPDTDLDSSQDVVEQAEENPSVESPDAKNSLDQEILSWDDAPSTTEEPAPRKPFQHAFVRSEDLHVEALGRPVDALILKNPNKMRKKQRVPPSVEPQPLEEVTWNQLQPAPAQPDEDALEYAMKNIESLRPTETSDWEDREIKELINMLTDGFTKKQLSHYIQQAVPTQEDAPRKQKGKRKNELNKTLGPGVRLPFWLEGFHPWEPLPKPPSEETSEMAESKPPGAQQVASAIVHDIWCIRPKEDPHQNEIGTIRMRIKEDILTLIKRPSLGILQGLEDILDTSSGETINCNPKKGFIYLQCCQHRFSLIVNDLRQKLAFLKRKFIYVFAKHSLVEPQLLEELGRLTNTCIRLNSSDPLFGTVQHQLTVTYLATADGSGAKPKPQRFENGADIVQRLLSDPVPEQLKTHAQVKWSGDIKSHGRQGPQRHDSERPNIDEVLEVMAQKESALPSSQTGEDLLSSNQGFVPAVSPEMRGMGWRDRMSTWTRYTAPVYKKQLRQRDLKWELYERDLNEGNDAIKLPTANHAEPGVIEKISATFGHILHCPRGRGPQEAEEFFNTETQDKEEWKQRAGNKKKVLWWSRQLAMRPVARRVLAPFVPHPAAFTTIKGSRPREVVQKTEIVLRFKHFFERDPTTHRVVSPIRAPTVLYRMPVSDDVDLSNFSIPEDSKLEAFLEWHATDVLRPSEEVDVQLVNTRHISLDTRSENVEAIKTFLDNSAFDLATGHIRTPATIKLTVPDAMTRPGDNTGSESRNQRYKTQRITMARQKWEAEVLIAKAHAIRKEALVEGGNFTPGEEELFAQADDARLTLATAEKIRSYWEEYTYSFMGTEIHQTVDIPWRDSTIRYTSIEAGLHGGRKQGISLHADAMDPVVGTIPYDSQYFVGLSETGEEELVSLVQHLEKGVGRNRSFLEQVGEIARGDVFSWASGSVKMKPFHADLIAATIQGGRRASAREEEDEATLKAEDIEKTGKDAQSSKLASEGDSEGEDAGQDNLPLELRPDREAEDSEEKQFSQK